MSTTSGRKCTARSIASRPLSASAMTTIPASCSAARTPLRNTASSSAMTTRGAAGRSGSAPRLELIRAVCRRAAAAFRRAGGSPSARTAVAATVRSVVLGTCSAISSTAAPATSAGRWPEKVTSAASGAARRSPISSASGSGPASRDRARRPRAARRPRSGRRRRRRPPRRRSRRRRRTRARSAAAIAARGCRRRAGSRTLGRLALGGKGEGDERRAVVVLGQRDGAAVAAPRGAGSR